MLLDDNDLVENPTTRVPIVFCLDTSGSMWGRKTDDLNQALNDFYAELLKDRTAKYAADACIVTFDSSCRIMQPFENISHGRIPAIKNPSGVTLLGEGANMALDCLESRKQEYKANGIEYYQPWLVLMSDGVPCQSAQSEIDRAVRRAIDLEANGKLTVFPIYISEGSYVDDQAVAILNKFSNRANARSFDSKSLPELFRWLSASAATVSHSSTGDEPTINFDDFIPSMVSMSEIL